MRVCVCAYVRVCVACVACARARVRACLATELDKSWTVMSSIYNHPRQGRDNSISELKIFIRAELELQERLETMGYRSPTWRLLRALQSLLSAVQLQGESAVTAPPFFPSAGRGTTKFWGKMQGPTVLLWESLDEGGREECERTICTHKDWVGRNQQKGIASSEGSNRKGKPSSRGK